MEVSFSNELQDKLSRLAAQQGRDSSALVVEAVERMVHHDEWFLAAVEEGIAAAERGDLIEEEEMDARVEKMLRS
jgi:predicted transcriptional regulator